MAARPAWVGPAPAALTSLVGRQRECAAVRDLLVRPGVRLVTLTGPGGVGKTRLAMQAAADLDGGFDVLAFVPLATIQDARLVPVTIAAALGVGSPDDAAGDRLRDHLRSRVLLLILDNVEHVVACGPFLADLLTGCPALTLLVTSRARLHISGEHVFPVSPLPPDPAVRLFVERARAVRPDFQLDDRTRPDVAEICRRLDGLPLAIELAAARTTVLPPAALLGRLTRRLPILTGGGRDVPERLRTMRAGIAWSYDLLPPAERELFRRLAVFAGGCTPAAAESMAGTEGIDVLDLIGGLVDKSLLQRVAGESRFTMLETIREYAVDQLGTEEAAARRAHAGYFRRLASQAAAGLRSADQQRWRDALDADLDNLRAALGWTLRDDATPADVDTGLDLVGALWFFWFQRGLTGEGRRWLARALRLAPATGRGRAEALLGAGTLAWRQGDCAAARGYLEESVLLWRRAARPGNLAEAEHVLGHVRFDQRDLAAARTLFTESLAEYRRAGDQVGSLPLIADLGLVAYHEGDYHTAEAVLRESLTLYRRHGLTDRVAGALNMLGDLARLAGDPARAERLYRESLTLWEQLRGTPGIASALHKLGQVSRSADGSQARRHFADSLERQREIGNRQGIAECLAGLAGVDTDDGRPERAVRIFAAVTAMLATLGVPLAPADRVTMESDLDTARSRLTGAARDAAWEAGSGMSTEDAIADALAEPVPDRQPGPLSHREQEVSRLVARGLTNREIARALSISEKTVGSHIAHIMAKLTVRSRTEIAVWAVGHGLGPSGG